MSNYNVINVMFKQIYIDSLILLFNRMFGKQQLSAIYNLRGAISVEDLLADFSMVIHKYRATVGHFISEFRDGR